MCESGGLTVLSYVDLSLFKSFLTVYVLIGIYALDQIHTSAVQGSDRYCFRGLLCTAHNRHKTVFLRLNKYCTSDSV